MLTSISIKNLAVVSELNLDLSTGMTALTGETGAGKSILIDALGLALGNKADKDQIRANCDKAEITAVFDITDINEAKLWLEQQELDDSHECHLRRVITRDNRSKAFINGSPAPLKSLQSLASVLLEIHGQHAHQRLLKRAFQLQSLDQYANHSELINKTTLVYEQWKDTSRQLEKIKSDEQDRSSRLDLLRFQAQELEQLNLQPGETQQLEIKFKTLSNADRLIQGCYELSGSLYEDDQAAHSIISSQQSKLSQLVALQPELASNIELLESALINIQECSDSLRHFADSLDTDNQTLTEIEQRLQSIYEFSRKYRLEPEELCKKASSVKDELNSLENADENLLALETQLSKYQKSFTQLAKKLNASRQKAADSLSKSTIDLLKTLAMPEVNFKIDLQEETIEKATRLGTDQVEFLVTSNPGQPLAPLKKVASGGELSRIALAIQVATMSNMNVPSLIFDEVDVGIGGGTAEIVGKLLRKLGSNQQVLCVTHLPQVAAQAHHHLKVAKVQTDKSTSTSISSLYKKDRIDEVARMLGGIEMTKQTIAHAKEMIEKAAL